MAVVIASVAWASGETLLPAVLVACAGAGHVVSAVQRRRRFRWGLVIYPMALLALWTLREDLLAIASGGALFPLAKFGAALLALVSFNLRSLRTLYDGLLLGLATILLASEGALSLHFALFLLVFGIAAVAFLATAHMVGAAQGRRWATAPGLLRLGGAMVGTLLLVFIASVAIFLAVPQSYRVRNAQPLPSRLDLTAGQPVAPDGLSSGDSAPWSQFLPSRDLESPAPESQVGGRGGQSPETGPQQGQGSGGSTPPTGSGSGPPVGGPRYATLGYVGDQGEDVVMRVRSPLASYWRGQVFDTYDGRGWVASEAKPQLILDAYGRLRFADASLAQDATETYVQTFFLSVPQPSAVFTGYSPGVIPLVGPSEGTTPWEQAVEMVRRMQQPGSYRVISAIPSLTPARLQQDTADTSYLRQMEPIPIRPRVRDLARSVVQGARTDYEKAARLERFLLDNYAYDLRVSPFPRSGDAVEFFLFERQAGYCAQFATAMAVMARSVGLPARVVAGYLPGEYDSLTGVHVVRLKDAHAWVEIKFRQAGWVPFDPTPRPDSPWALDRGFKQATRSFQQVLRGQLRDVVTNGPSSVAGGAVALFRGQDPARVGGLASLVSIPLLGLGLAVALRRRGATHRRRHWWGAYTPLPGDTRLGVRKAYARALRVMERKGYPGRQPHQSPEEYVAALEAQLLPLPPAFLSLSRLATDALYNPHPPAAEALLEARQLLKDLQDAPSLARER